MHPGTHSLSAVESTFVFSPRGWPVACTTTLFAADRAQQRHQLVKTRKSDQSVDQRTQHRGLPEAHPEQRGYQVEVGECDQSPVQSAHNHEHCSNHLQSFHRLNCSFSFFAVGLPSCFNARPSRNYDHNENNLNLEENICL